MDKPYTITDIKNKITNTARQYGIQKAYLFGSYVRGDAGLESDIDICIEKGKLRTLFELSGFCRDLEETLGNKVDVVTTVSLSGDFKKQIEKDMILIYE
ncbi:MAG: nucleotidyltransferase domain-containing protein [Spirochaetaceae bacterium]|jgi:predicted nucleotidyltransferase|nr:nucleotidyltransferase domain-containing protein [Spirochaetaceae bacterium]